jgi:ABC-type sugar transport system substrate-binding protein
MVPMMGRRTVALTVALALGLALAVSACGSSSKSSSGTSSGSSASGGGSKTIAVNMYSREIPYFVQVLKGMQTEGSKLGWKINPTFGNNDPTLQVNQLQTAIATHPDAMTVIPIDEHALIPAYQQAKTAGITVVSVGDNVAPSAYHLQLTFVGDNYADLGKTKAQLIINHLHGKGTVGWIHGIRGLNFSEQQRIGGTPVFKSNSGITLVDGPYGGAFSSDAGLTATQNLLSRNPNLNAIYYDNDDLALGGIQALKGRGIDPSKVFIVGTDGGPVALAAVKKGSLNATYSLCGYAQGVRVIDILNQYFSHKTQPPNPLYMQPLEFTPANYTSSISKVTSGQC